MSRNSTRLFLAALLSVGGALATFYWDKKNNPEYKKSDTRRGLAYIRKPIGNVKRKSIEDYTAFPVREGTSLFEDDSILTEASSEVIIEFPNQKDSTKIASTLYLDSDSKIVLKQESGAISLDLLEGTLDLTNTGALTLNTESGKIDLSKAKNLKLTKAEDSNIRVKVNEGSVEIKDKDGRVQKIKSGESKELSQDGKIVQKEDFNFISPQLGFTFKTKKDTNRLITIKWMPLKQTSELYLESGTSRKTMKPVTFKKISDREIHVTWPEGERFWKLKAIDPATKKLIAESTPQKIIIESIEPPLLSDPQDRLTKIVNGPEKLTFSWTLNRDDYQSQTLELLSNSKTPKVLQSLPVPLAQTSTELAAIPPGVYGWQVKAKLKDSSEVITSSTRLFALIQKEVVKVAVKWDPKAKDLQQYVGEPNINLGWTTDKPAKVKQWRLKLLPEGSDPATNTPIELTETNFSNKLDKPGRFIASVEAIGEDNEVIGVSPQKQIEVSELPPPQAPTFTELKKPEDVLKAGRNGVAKINLDSVQGAQEYKVTITDSKQKVTEHLTASPNLKITDLQPGTYTIKSAAKDTYGRWGEESLPRTMVVPDKNDLAAPVLKGTTVK